MKYSPAFFAPDIDANWNVTPGALIRLDAFAPLQNGWLGSIGTFNFLSGSPTLTGTDHLNAYMFPQVDGTVRLLTFRAANIDEYTNAGARTNQGTGYNASTTGWQAAAYGNQIIAVNYLDAPTTSTGTTFGALGGSPPNARLIAVNGDFVMLGDHNSGGTIADGVFWSGIGNPTAWTPSIATQCGNYRLRDAPGPLRALVAYRDVFVAFKDNSIFIGEYIGPPYVWGWRLVSNRIGCVGPNAVAELDGKLYFYSLLGFFEFDGQSLRNIGLPVHHSFAQETGSGVAFSGATYGWINPSSSYTFDSVSQMAAYVDDLEGVVWWGSGYNDGISATRIFYGYSPRSGRWGRWAPDSSLGYRVVPVHGTAADRNAFVSAKAKLDARFLYIANNPIQGTTLQAAAYPYTPGTTETGINITPSFTTGPWGSGDNSVESTSVLWRSPPAGNGGGAVTVTANATALEANTNGSLGSTFTGIGNTDFDRGDVVCNARYRTHTVTFNAKRVIAGIDITAGTRR